MTQFSLDGKQIVILYEEDGSQWFFLGFAETDGSHYMKLRPHAETLKQAPTLKDGVQLVPLDEQDYQYVKEDIDRLTRKL